jgi:hypothetical protein
VAGKRLLRDQGGARAEVRRRCYEPADLVDGVAWGLLDEGVPASFTPAVTIGLTLAWNTGAVEGTVCKLKAIKRTMSAARTSTSYESEYSHGRSHHKIADRVILTCPLTRTQSKLQTSSATSLRITRLAKLRRGVCPEVGAANHTQLSAGGAPAMARFSPARPRRHPRCFRPPLI